MQAILFYVFAGVGVLAALMMILHRNPVFSAILLIVTLFALAGFYVMLNAPFVASVHLIIYAGAIMVLFLFVIMLLNLQKDAPREGGKFLRRFAGTVLIIAFLAELGAMLAVGFWGKQTWLPSHPAGTTAGVAGQTAAPAGPTVGIGEGIIGSTRAIGTELFTTYLLPFEIASVILLVAMVGAVILAKRKLR